MAGEDRWHHRGQKKQERPAAPALASKLLSLVGLCLAIFSAKAWADGVTTNELFLKACAPCHSKDGKAQTPAAKKLGVKDLSQSKLTDAQIVQQILEGKQTPNADSKMPAFKEKLSQAEVDSLVPVVKEFRK